MQLKATNILLFAVLGVGLWGLFVKNKGPSPPPVDPVKPAPSAELQQVVAGLKAIGDANKDSYHWGELYGALGWAVRNQQKDFTYAQVSRALGRLQDAYTNEKLPKVPGQADALAKAINIHLGTKPVKADKNKVADFFDAVAWAMGD